MASASALSTARPDDLRSVGALRPCTTGPATSSTDVDVRRRCRIDAPDEHAVADLSVVGVDSDHGQARSVGITGPGDLFGA